MAGLALPPVWTHAGPVAGCLVIAGGLLYVLGAFGYHLRWPNPSPSVVGYHEVFHAFVCAAATCHYVAVATLVGMTPGRWSRARLEFSSKPEFTEQTGAPRKAAV